MTDEVFDDEISSYEEFSNAFDQDEDPLAEFDSTFKNIDRNPIELYKQTKLKNANITEKWHNQKVRTIDKYQEFMQRFEREPACPRSQHIGKYINHLCGNNISTDYIQSQLRILANMFDYWNDHPSMPHGTGSAEGFNPVGTAVRLKEDYLDQREVSSEKSVYQIPIETIAHKIRNVKNILHRSVITTQFKYGLRAGQASGMQIQDLKIDHDGINQLYPNLGTHQRIGDIDAEVLHFPDREERPGVKSSRPIVVPIDSELRRVLINYLRHRPPVDLPWLFINNSTGGQLNTSYINSSMWKPAFHPEYSGTDRMKPVTSHYGRHRFATYWRKEMDLKREDLKYLRGDKQGNFGNDRSDALDDYVHTYYTHIKDIYLQGIYKFNI